MDNEYEQVDSQSTEATEPTQNTTVTPTVDVSALEQKNKELYARAKKAEEEAKALRAKVSPQETTSTNPPSEQLERIELKVDGYSADEVDFLLSVGGKKALENPIIGKAIEALRAEKRSLEATPNPSGQSPVYKTYSQADLNNMSLEEIQKILPH